LASLVHGGVLAGVAPDTVKALAALAPARYIPATLAQLGAPWSHAVAELERLSERGLFVERQDNGDLRLHDLFCSALRREPIDDEERETAVAALTNIGRCELALGCILSVPNCGKRLGVWLAQHGDPLLVRSEVGNLAIHVLEQCAEPPAPVLLWCARGAQASDLTLSDVTAERAFTRFEIDGNVSGQRRCCGVGLLTQSVLLDGRRLELWRARFVGLPRVSDGEFSLSPLLEGGARLVEHVLQSGRDTPEIQALHARLKAALLEQQPAQEAILAASVLVFALLQLQRRQEMPALLTQMETSPWFGLTPAHAQVEWHLNKGFSLLGLGRLELAAASLGVAIELARSQGLNRALRSGLSGLARVQLMMGELGNAEATIARAHALPGDGVGYMRADELCLKAWCELARNRTVRALSELETAEKLLDGAGLSIKPPLERARVQVLYAAGQQGEALQLAERCVTAHEGASRDNAECDRSLLVALRMRSENPALAREALLQAIQLIEQRRWTSYLLLLPHLAGEVAHWALKQESHLDVIRDSIRERRLPAPPGAGSDWPWPLRIFVLGEWRLERFDEVMEFRGKVQRKPLELLKYLACARDQSAEHGSVCAALWPDAEEFAARRSLEMATARLREMLGNASWVRVSEGRTRLDREFVWSDAQAVWQACNEAERADKNRISVEQLATCAGAILELYRGVPLAGDEETPWVLGVRERLRAAFVRSARAFDLILHESGQHDLAISLLERAYAAEPLAEELAQRLMKAHIDRGRPGEAMRVYRSLRQMFSVLLGRQPGAAVEQLRQSILNQSTERRVT
jgi:DNA-binding SARP family transcriptional activator